MSIAGYILTGGENRRMNGQKKLFLTLNGDTFLHAIMQALSDMETIYLSVDKEEPYSNLSLPCVVDLYPAFGPLGGICSGLKQCKEEALFVVPCDMPFLTKDVIWKVIDQYARNPGHIVIVRSGKDLQPLCGIYPKMVLPKLEEMIANDQHRVRDLFRECKPSILEIENENTLLNINTPEEYNQIQNSSTPSAYLLRDARQLC